MLRFMGSQRVGHDCILEIVSRKASSILGRQIGVFVVDMTQKPMRNPRMAQLMDFGKNHPDIVKIKNN